MLEKEVNAEEPAERSDLKKKVLEACGSASNGGDEDKRPLSPSTLELMCDEQDTYFLEDEGRNTTNGLCTNENSSEHLAWQENLVLTRFRDFINTLISAGPSSVEGKTL